MSERLQKFLARSGVASRRHAEGLITAGRVTVNNQRVTELGTKVEPTDLVTVDGTLVTAPERTSWYLLHKPTGVVTTLSDPEGRPTVAGLLEGVEQRVFPVGRLDWDAEGALLVTNDGEAAHRLLHPSFEVPRTYLAKVKGTPTDETLARLRDGVRLEDGDARAIRADRFEVTEKNTWLVLQVGEGRPHLVKRLCAAVGHPVVRLFRPAQAGISVAGLQPGELRPLTAEEMERVLAVAAGKDVDEPTLFLPPRRHGRAGGGEDEEAESEGSPDGAVDARARTKGPGGGARAGAGGAEERGTERLGIRPSRGGARSFGGGAAGTRAAGRGRPGWGAGGTREGGAPAGGFRRGGFGASRTGDGARGPRSGPPGSRDRFARSPGEGGRGRGPRSGPPRSRDGFGETGDARRGPRAGPPQSRERFGGPSGERERGPRSGPPGSRERFGSAPGERGR
ncbi:MAG: pseudouridine synthase, partial [Myxococcaceae bacterium]